MNDNPNDRSKHSTSDNKTTTEREAAKETSEANRAIGRRDKRGRGEAAAGKVRMDMPQAAAGVLVDNDPALDDESETEEALERASRNRRDRMTGET